MQSTAALRSAPATTTAPRRAAASAAVVGAPLAGTASAQRPQVVARALEIDWTDSDTWIGVAGAVLGLGLGIGAPIVYGIAAGERGPFATPAAPRAT